MKKPITVKILVTVNNMSQFRASTLCFESLRVGWPTADIHVYVNGGEHFQATMSRIITISQARKDGRHCTEYGPEFTVHGVVPDDGTDKIHHAEWIRKHVKQEYSGPLVIADPDIVYWKSCEDWEFLPKTLFAGYWHPRMWNDFAQCVSVQRIHTSMMVFPDTAALWDGICEAYPLAQEPHGEYCPCDPFMPAVRFDGSIPTFWDTCANLYNMLLSIKGEIRQWPALEHFGSRQLSCYDHLNSASFYDVMVERLDEETSQGFVIAHREWVKNPTPGLWRLVDEYYKQKAIEGWVKCSGDRTLKV